MAPDAPLARAQASALADLSARLAVQPASIEIVASEEVIWPNGSLGCPQPGMSYTQAEVAGYRVILRHHRRIYRYHAGGDARPVLCRSDEKDGGYEFVPPPRYDV
jgi:hypothetical protein